VDNFVDSRRREPREARKIKGLAVLPGKSAYLEIVLNQGLGGAIVFGAEDGAPRHAQYAAERVLCISQGGRKDFANRGI